jgi:hypothetical protein
MVVEPLVVALLLAAALMHATWNALLKADRSDRLATFGVIMTTGTVMGLVAVPFLPWIELRRLEVPGDLGDRACRLLHLPAEGLFLRRPQPHLSDRARHGARWWRWCRAS